MHIALVGNPNSGKSSVINRLTGSSLFTSNYPGASNEIMSAQLKIGESTLVFYDTPGIYSLMNNSRESKTCRELLANLHLEMIIHVIDAANLERNLVLTAELLQLEIPVLILINQVDRARELGIEIDSRLLQRLTASPVILFSAESGEGVPEVLSILKKLMAGRPLAEEKTGAQIVSTPVPCNSCDQSCSRCAISVESLSTPDDDARAAWAQKTAALVAIRTNGVRRPWLNYVESILDRAIVGTAVLLLLLYLGFLLLVKFISWSEGGVSSFLHPLALWLEQLIVSIMPAGFFTTVLSHAIPEGLVIPLTIIMPAMLMVSLLMAVLEDTGLLPRYSVSLERAGRLFGVSGQAVIPFSLAFGCRTPAILATRILGSDAQRFITVTLLSIVVPCAATVGIMAMVISHFHAYPAVLVLSMLAVLMLLGYVLKQFMPIEESFIYELPPLRIPAARNIWSKVRLRFAGFFTEVLPLILIMSIAVRILIESRVLEKLDQMDSLSLLLFGIPAQALGAVLITVFQRYLAPLVLLNLNLSPREATIAITMVALSVPCLPAMVMTVREIGAKSLLKVIILGFLTSFTIGILLNLLLPQ